MARRDKRFTIYDMMESRGDFDLNKANATSPDYAGPQPYPRLFYHPSGEMRIINPGEIIVTPLGPKKLGEQREMIWQQANNKAEADALRAAGWHDHPAKAIAAGGGEAPPVSADDRIKDLEEQIAQMRSQANDARAKQLADDQAALTKSKAKTKDFMAAANTSEL